MIESVINVLFYLLLGAVMIGVLIVVGFYRYMATSAKRNRIQDHSNIKEHYY